jgi:sec-independent protein translocase protein TatA
MVGMFEGPEIFIVLGILVLLFGSAQLPKLARNFGQAQKEFKKAFTEGGADDKPAPHNPT